MEYLKNFQSPRLPDSVYEQIANLPKLEIRTRIAKNLYEAIQFLLESHLVFTDQENSGFRVKTDQNVKEKLDRKKDGYPLRDIYGIRLIISPQDRNKVRDVVSSAYPNSPRFFKDGKPNPRDYSDPIMRERYIEKHNPFTSPFYSALHINIAFERLGSVLLELAEVQVMTISELEIYQATRRDYESSRSPFTLSIMLD